MSEAYSYGRQCWEMSAARHVAKALPWSGGQEMSKESVFTPEELEAMGKRTVDLIESTLEADDKETAKQLSQRMYREFLSLHDLYRDWVTALLSFIGRHYGDDALHEAMEETVAVWIKPLCERYAGKSTRRKVELLAAGLRAHLHPFTVEEDEDSFTISGLPCGSGGRLVLEGAYDPPRSFLKIQKAQPMTFKTGQISRSIAPTAFSRILCLPS